MTDTKITIERELELIDGMIEVQLHHAEQCDHIANRTITGLAPAQETTK